MFNLIKKFCITDNSESLAKRTAKGSFWLLAFRVFDQTFRFIRTIILARLLAPSDFGLFGITLMAVSFLDTFSQSGFQQALVQKKEDIKPYLDTSWLVQATRGFLIALSLFVFAPYIALFFKSEESELILRVISLAIFIQGLTSIATVYISKELEYKKYFIYQISGTIVDFLVSIILAFVLHNVWALVFGYVAGAILRCVVSYIVYSYIPKLKFDFSKAKELFVYGKWVFGSNIIGFFVTQIDSLFVAKISGITSLGFYQMAQRIPSILGMEVLAGATFPAYSKIQDDKEKLKDAYLRIVKLFCLILMPIGGGIFVVAPEFVRIFLGENWMPSVWPMRFLSLSALAWTMAVVSNYMFLAVGKPHIETKWSSVRLVIMLVLLYPFVLNFGFLGASIVVLIGSLVAALGFSFEAIKITKCGFSQFMDSTIFSFINALIMTVLVYSLRGILYGSLLEFILTILIGVLLYFLLTLASDKIFNTKSLQLLKESIGLLKR